MLPGMSQSHDPAVKLGPAAGGTSRRGASDEGASGRSGASDSSMPIVYRKTAKGVAEIETRAHRLPPRLRGALIVVDGKRPDTELAALMPQATDSLAQLLQGGFIEVVMTLAAPPAPAPAAVVPSNAVPVVLPKPPAPSPAASGWGSSSSATVPGDPAAADFPARRRAVLRLINDLLGPAGEGLAMKLEKTKNLDELRAMLPQAVQLVGNVRGRSQAEAFAAKLDEL